MLGNSHGNLNAVETKQVGEKFSMRILVYIYGCQKCLSFSDTYYKITIKYSGEKLAFIRHQLVYLISSVWTWIYAL